MNKLAELLTTTSRTFALAIPMLPEPARTDVAVAYLVFRIADTLEDAEHLAPSDRVQALAEFDSVLGSPNSERIGHFVRRWTARPITGNLWCRELLLQTGFVLQRLEGREAAIRSVIRNHAQRTTLGMASFQEDGEIEIESTQELRRYCYVAAGIVGEMLTSIFALRIPAFTRTPQTTRLAIAFAEGLQLVNILKDANEDSKAGRRFLPPDASRSELMAIARDDLRRAKGYVERLSAASAPTGYVAFATLPLKLAWATLDRVEELGPGAKTSRAYVAQVLAELGQAGTPQF